MMAERIDRIPDPSPYLPEREPARALPPGRLAGREITQVRPDVYQITDEQLREIGFADAQQFRMAIIAELQRVGSAVVVSYDSPSAMTTFEVLPPVGPFEAGR